MAKAPSALAIVFIIATVLTILTVLLLCWNDTNMIFTYTFLLPSSSPGLLTSGRNTAFWWFLQISVAMGILLIFFSGLRLADLKSTAYYWLHLVVSIIAFIIWILFFIFHLVESADCNVSTGTNICSDYRWCCVYGTVDPAPAGAFCPGVDVACSPVAIPADLGWNGVFAFSFGISIVLVVLGLLHIIFGLVLGTGSSSSSSKDDTEGLMEDEFQDDGLDGLEIEGKIPLPSSDVRQHGMVLWSKIQEHFKADPSTYIKTE